jgi:hypothetical protein
VRREHHVNGAITDRQRGHIGIDQRRAGELASLPSRSRDGIA